MKLIGVKLLIRYGKRCTSTMRAISQVDLEYMIHSSPFQQSLFPDKVFITSDEDFVANYITNLTFYVFLLCHLGGALLLPVLKFVLVINLVITKLRDTGVIHFAIPIR